MTEADGWVEGSFALAIGCSYWLDGPLGLGETVSTSAPCHARQPSPPSIAPFADMPLSTGVSYYLSAACLCICT